MSVRRHLHFGSTPNFANLYTQVKANTDRSGRLAYANYDPSLGELPTEAQTELLQSYQPVMPILTFVGSEKLHGENMAVCYSQGELWVQGRNHIRTLLGDQNGMAHFVEANQLAWLMLITQLKDKNNISTDTHTIVIDCEWAGGNIQKGNAACSGTEKGAYMFDYFRVVSNADDSEQLLSTTGVALPASNIYNMASFGEYSISIDFNRPEEAEQALLQLALDVEASSKIAKYFDKPDNVGEGIYFYSVATEEHPSYRLKVKGDKHGGKPKTPREPKETLSDVELEAITALAHTITPVWRITQAITETNATERKHLGEVIKWVISDIAKEEVPTLAKAGVELKEISRYISSIIKDYFFDSLKDY